jgi:hypothetical protein
VRQPSDQEALWQALALGDLQTVSSDHAPYRFDASGKFINGADSDFKAIPNGMLGYLLGKVVNISGQIAFALAITLLAGALEFTGLAIGSPGRWLTLAWVLVLGLLATLPLGAVLGSLFPSQRSAGPVWILLLGGLAAISGIFYPITHLPTVLQWTGQAFPMYWLGLGMRSALLPNAMAAVEVGHSWRHLATFGVLIGTISAVKTGTFLDRATMTTALVAISAPVYWLYRRTLEIKRNRDRRKHEAELRARERASAEKTASATKSATNGAVAE